MNEIIEHESKCTECGERITPDEWYTSDDGDLYCAGCYFEKFVSCAQCNKELYKEEQMLNDEGTCYCESCYYDNYTRCEDCDREIDVNTETYYVVKGEHYCRHCVEVK